MPKIIDAYLGLTALREAGYRSTATAISELVDNSIEAKASAIDIIALNQKVVVSSRTSNQVQRIAVLDNGIGMPEHVLENCLSLGWGTRLDTRDGLGRFGFGLKGSSISQARRVEVYSWTNPSEVYMAYMDLDEIHDNQSQELKEIVKTKIPKEISQSFKDKIGNSGTLVMWDRLDKIDIVRSTTLVKRINKELCRIYRHFLDDCDIYGTKRDIKIHSLQLENNKVDSLALRANDPLYLLTPNNLPDYEDKQTNVLHEEFSIDVEYHGGVSKVEFRCTIAKPEIQNLTGNSTVGKHYAENTGISFVRAGREIDFGAFGFIDRSEPRHRWWGIEIRFDPVLDELFEITNNKQEVRSIKKFDLDMLLALQDEADQGNSKSKMLIQINKILSDHISSMMKIITSRREGVNKKKAAGSVADKVNKQIAHDNALTESKVRSESLTEEEKVRERVTLLMDDDTSLDIEEAEQQARETIDYKIDLTLGKWPGDLFLDRKPVGNASVGVINRDTAFYSQFWRHLEGQSDRKGIDALEVIMMSLIRAEDELATTYDKRVFERYRQKWSTLVEQLLSDS